MNPDTVGLALKELAQSWPTPDFDSAILAAQGSDRSKKRRRRAAVSSALLALTAGAAIAALAAPATGPASHPSLDRSATSDAPGIVAPAIPPPVRITPIGKTLGTIDHVPVLARARIGEAVTVRARLYFLAGAEARVHGVALVIAEPGTESGASPDTADSYYRNTRIAISAKVAATSPEQRILSVSTPATLVPGNYPVLTVIDTDLLPGQRPGIQGPFVESSEIGIIVITR